MSTEEAGEEVGEVVGLPPSAEFVICPVCGAELKSRGRYGHFKIVHKDMNYNDYKNKFVPAPPHPTEPPKTEEAPPETVYKAGSDINNILKGILENHPDVPKKVIGEIMSWAEMSPGGLHPTNLAWLLSSMKGVTGPTANVVSQKYAMALAKAQQEGALGNIPLALGIGYGLGQTPQNPQFGMWQQRGTGFGPIGSEQPPASGYYTKEDMEREMNRNRSEWLKEEKLRKLEEEISSLRKDLPKMLKEAQPEVSGQYEEVTEYIDAKGNICDPTKAASIRVRKIPVKVDVQGLTMEDVRAIMREEREVLTPDKVKGLFREMIREEIPRKGGEESPDVKALREQLNNQMKSFEDLKGQLAAQDRKVLEDKIADLRDRLDVVASTGTGEWKSDETRLIRSALNDLTGVVKVYMSGERPLDKVERVLFESGGKRKTLSSEMAGETERGGVIKGLREQGLVTFIRERARGEQ